VLELAPDVDTDYSLQRLLAASDGDVEETTTKLHRYVRITRLLHLHEQHFSSIADVNAFVQQYTAAAEFFPGGLMGHDREGNVISVQPMARAVPRSQMQCESVSRLLVLAISVSEGLHRVVRAEERRRGRRLGLRVIVDLEGLSLDLLHKPSLAIGLQALALLQTLFPDSMIRNVYVINAPATVRYFYSIVQTVISKHTKRTTEFLDANWRQRLCDELGEENIFPHWGGTKAHHKPTGWIRMGGSAPMSMMYNRETSEHEVDDALLNTLTVAARSLQRVPIEVERVPCRLKWLFRCQSGDVDFSVEHGDEDKGNNEEVWPKLRLSTHYVPECGSIECLLPGRYTLMFDNSHSRFSSKQIYYAINVLPIEK